ncbi:MAG: hypothetical protein JWM69_456 [Candidatus Binatus sp.]|nr:hypothetical protein [Candidatus Binatus sp.]
MPIVNVETVKQVLRAFYGYEISDTDAHAIAHSAGAMLTLASHMPALGLAGIEPPFGYPTLLSEAARVAKSRH